MDETTNTTSLESVREKGYTLRNLEAKDIFLMSKIIGEIGLKEFTDCIQSDAIKQMIGQDNDEGKDELTTSLGFMVLLNVADVIIKHLPRCEKDIYTFLSSLSGMDKSQIETMPAAAFTEMIIDVFQKEEFGDFMKVVSKLFK